MQQQQFSMRNCSTDAQVESLMPCSCGLFQGVDDAGPGAFSIFFATAAINDQHLPEDCDPSCEPPSSAVDCTLSLGTPSTRHQSSPTSKPSPSPAVIQGQQWNAVYPLHFDFLRTDHPKQTSPAAAATGGTTVPGTGGAGLKVGGEPVLLPRRCASCDTTSTPLWRNGPRGPKSLCNACGIRYKKEERRAATSAAAQSSTSSSSSSASTTAANLEAPPLQQEQQHLATGYGSYHHPWGYPASRLAAARKCPSSAIFSAISLGDNVDAVEAAALPYIPWQRFNVTAPPQAAEFVTSRFQDYSFH